jgi:hypothetical protein
LHNGVYDVRYNLHSWDEQALGTNFAFQELTERPMVEMHYRRVLGTITGVNPWIWEKDDERV